MAVHNFGRECATMGKHDLTEFKLQDIITFYCKIFNLYYADEKSKEWLAKKIREDIPMMYENTKDSGVSLLEIKYQWCKTHYNFLRNFLKEHYVPISSYFDEHGHNIEQYEVWIEEVEYKNPIAPFIGKP